MCVGCATQCVSRVCWSLEFVAAALPACHIAARTGNSRRSNSKGQLECLQIAEAVFLPAQQTHLFYHYMLHVLTHTSCCCSYLLCTLLCHAGCQPAHNNSHLHASQPGGPAALSGLSQPYQHCTLIRPQPGCATRSSRRHSATVGCQHQQPATAAACATAATFTTTSPITTTAATSTASASS